MERPDDAELRDPATTSGRLDDLADEYPEFHSQIAAHPHCSEQTRQWIFAQNPSIRRAFEERQALQEAESQAAAERASAAQASGNPSAQRPSGPPRNTMDQVGGAVASPSTAPPQPAPAPSPPPRPTGGSKSSGGFPWKSCCGCLVLLVIVLGGVGLIRGCVNAVMNASQSSSGSSQEDLASPAPDDAMEMSTLISPSENITCSLAEDKVACSIVYRDEKKVGCAGNDYATYIIGADSEKPKKECKGRHPKEAPGSLTTLEYGQTAVNGEMACSVEKDGMTCWSQKSGHGFKLSKDEVGKF